MTTLRQEGPETLPDLDPAVSALAAFRSGLAADGYVLEVTRHGAGGLRVEIVAGADACEECLIPKEMFEGMVRARLASEGVRFSGISVVYPAA